LHKQGIDFAPSKNTVHAGFIAQEVKQASTDCGFQNSIVSVPTDPNVSSYGMDYSEMVVPLVKAVQELAKTVDSLKA
ncbi:hypothetical protein ACI4BE_30325, partial [Klebsiella pneumoniae]|uniref:hypothetical protein n=1 Tax=Klebsiella pneumoniae TaxID=573 RepID=UPI003853C099